MPAGKGKGNADRRSSESGQYWRKTEVARDVMPGVGPLVRSQMCAFKQHIERTPAEKRTRERSIPSWIAAGKQRRETAGEVTLRNSNGCAPRGIGARWSSLLRGSLLAHECRHDDRLPIFYGDLKGQSEQLEARTAEVAVHNASFLSLLDSQKRLKTVTG